MQRAPSRSVRENLGFDFQFLPDYAAFLLRNCLDDLVSEIHFAYKKMDEPFIRSFKNLSEEEQRLFLTRAVQEMLTLLAANKIGEHIDEVIRNWLTRQLPFNLKGPIHSEDITLVTYTREKVLRKFLPAYTKDPDLWLRLIDEITRFTAVLTSEAFSLYVDLQQEEMSRINTALRKRERQLLEAQEVGHGIIERLRESESLHNQAQALTHIGNWTWHPGDDKIMWSDELYRIYGLQPQSVNITPDLWLSFVHPDDAEMRKAQVQRWLNNLRIDEHYFRINSADGLTKILKAKGEVIADAEGRPVVIRGTCQDVTHEVTLTQQLRERERYLEELNLSLKMANEELSRTNEELESFNFIASHDLQEPLRKIQVYSSRILENELYVLPEKLQDYFGRINAASRRMQNLIDDFLAFSQTFDSSKEVEKIALNELVEEIRSELATRIEEKGAVLEVETLPTLWSLRFQMKQLLVNLITNALKYTRFGITPVVHISGSVLPGKDVALPEADPAISYIRIQIRDNGIGFDPKYKLKIFELFQRLHGKNVYSGTGIGLALCKKIIRNLGGFIMANGVPNQGAVFTFYVPREHRKGNQFRR